MTTKLVSQWKISPDRLLKHEFLNSGSIEVKERLSKDIDDFVNGNESISPVSNLLNSCFDGVLNELVSNRWVCLDNNIYLDKNAKGFWCIKDEVLQCGPYNSRSNCIEIESLINPLINDPINKWNIPKIDSLRKLTGLSNTPFKISNGRVAYDFKYIYALENNQCQGIDADDGCYGNIGIGRVIPFLPLIVEGDSDRALFVNILIRGFYLQDSLESESYKILLKIFHIGNNSFLDFYCHNAYQVIFSSMLEENLLNNDKKRADISPYHEKVLEDTELGHWELWQDDLIIDDYLTLELPRALIARDPKASINDGVVAIDFGTKSTVVVYQQDTVNIHPMRVGTGDLSKEIDASHYENPTIMEFIDLDAFISAYIADCNKPETRWEDLTISHTAQNSMQGSESSKFNTFLDEIKQWAGDRKRKLKIVDQQGNIIDLPAFLDLEDSDFNPIEIYAYYLGLYINNLSNGIFMNYILSFPVTYEMEVRDKIIKSFELGLKKSLPAELGQGKISELSVVKGASEPAAYALTALKNMKVDPVGEERIFYSVFDFGGGTTDFDFGIYREANGRKERRFDYVIEHFGAGGDKFLGGENLLELLAFEIFKKNKSSLLAAKIQFVKHPEKDAFAGSEELLSYSQEAKTNTKQLCVALRPYWEGHKDFSFGESGEIAITLTDVNGIQQSAFSLSIEEQELDVILESRIESGVVNFFESLRLAFSNSQSSLSDIEKIHIFLAGNSSKSCFVKPLFEKYIKNQTQEMSDHGVDCSFNLVEPLGVDENDIEKPTAKTGVAFGLIEAREGGRIKVVDKNIEKNDIRFKFYLGENRKGKFKPIVTREINFNQWVEFTDAYYKKFEIFFTDQPKTSTGEVSVTDSCIKKKSINLDMIDDEAFVYIRAVSPTIIEYVVATESDIKSDIYLNEPKSIEL